MTMDLDDVERLLRFNDALRRAVEKAPSIHPEHEPWEPENDTDACMAEMADWLVEKFRRDVAARAEDPRP